MNPWNRRFTPCLTQALLKDFGYPSACERDMNALLAMMIDMYLSRKAVYMGNPDIDTESNFLTIHHSIASLKMKGLDKPDSKYEIDNFAKAGFGATLRHDFNEDKGDVVTLCRFDPTAEKVLLTTGRILEGGGLDGCGCSQKVSMAIPDGGEFLARQQDFGHHLAMVFGDYTCEIGELSRMMSFEVVSVL